MFLLWPLTLYWFASSALSTASVLEYLNEPFLPISLRQSHYRGTTEKSGERWSSIQPSCCTSVGTALRGALQFALDKHSIPLLCEPRWLFLCSWFDINMVISVMETQTKVVFNFNCAVSADQASMSMRSGAAQRFSESDACYFHRSSAKESLVVVGYW